MQRENKQAYICTVSYICSFIVVTLRYIIVLDVRNNVFHSVNCSSTRLPELYEGSSKVLKNLHNFFPFDTVSHRNDLNFHQYSCGKQTSCAIVT